MMQVTIDKAGRIVIPQKLREEFNLRPGDRLNLARENGHMTLGVPSKGAMIKKHGIWVYSSGTGGTITQDEVNALMDALREGRDEDLAG